MTSKKVFLYWDWIEAEAKAINSDGCTLVTELFRPCCLQHDLGYYWAKDPRDAYVKWLQLAIENPWQEARTVGRDEVDIQFRDCIQSKSRVEHFSPISWLRYVGVRIGGWWAWRKHRKSR